MHNLPLSLHPNGGLSRPALPRVGPNLIPPCTIRIRLPRTLLAERNDGVPEPQDAMAVALLIDGENCAPDLVATALVEACRFGSVHVRRVYANPAVLGQRGWHDALVHHQLEAVHHERTALGKNATDIALVVEAMDLLHDGAIDCFCLLASDSDYTPLVKRLRAAGRVVVGLGRAQTPPALTQACSVFITLERVGNLNDGSPASPLRLVESAKLASQPIDLVGAPACAGTDVIAAPLHAPALEVKRAGGAPTQATPHPGRYQDNPAPLLLNAWAKVFQARGEVSLSNFVIEIQRTYPGCMPQHYGFERWTTLIRQRSDLFTVRQGSGNGGNQIVDRVDELLAPSRQASTNARPASAAQPLAKVPPCSAEGALRAMLVTALRQALPQGGWLGLSAFGIQLRRIDPSFSARAHGHAQLKGLLKAHPDLFELRQRGTSQCDIRLNSAVDAG